MSYLHQVHLSGLVGHTAQQTSSLSHYWTFGQFLGDRPCSAHITQGETVHLQAEDDFFLYFQKQKTM